MAVTNDGTNYFSGNIVGGVDLNTLRTDLESIETSLGIEIAIRNPGTQNNDLAWRTNLASEPFTGTVSPFTGVNMNINSANPPSDARFLVQLGFGLGGGADTLFVAARQSNVFNDNTNIDNVTIGISGAGFSNNDFNSAYSSATNWTVVDANSLSIFRFVDANNYYFVSTGTLLNVASHSQQNLIML